MAGREQEVLAWAWGAATSGESARGLAIGLRDELGAEPFLGPSWSVFQPHAGERAGLAERGATLIDAEGGQGPHDAVVVIPPAQQVAAQATLARAVLAAAPGASVVVAAANDLGGARHAKLLLDLLGGGEQDGRRHCRWAAGVRPEEVDVARLTELAGSDAPRPVLDGSIVSRPGLFSWNEADPGSRLLARHLPPDLEGTAIDLGAGWGWLSGAALQRCRGIRRVLLVEVDGLALPLAQRNLARFDGVEVVGVHADVRRGLSVGGADVVWMNPPFHDLGATDTSLGHAFVDAAARVLAPHGVLWMVANVRLAYEVRLRERFSAVRIIEERAGYKVIAARGPRPG